MTAAEDLTWADIVISPEPPPKRATTTVVERRQRAKPKTAPKVKAKGESQPPPARSRRDADSFRLTSPETKAAKQTKAEAPRESTRPAQHYAGGPITDITPEEQAFLWRDIELARDRIGRKLVAARAGGWDHARYELDELGWIGMAIATRQPIEGLPRAALPPVRPSPMDPCDGCKQSRFLLVFDAFTGPPHEDGMPRWNFDQVMLPCTLCRWGMRSCAS